jgi:hypothetical protein
MNWSKMVLLPEQPAARARLPMLKANLDPLGRDA